MIRVGDGKGSLAISRRRVDPCRVDFALQSFAGLARKPHLAVPALGVESTPRTDIEACDVLWLAVRVQRQSDQFRGGIMPGDASKAHGVLTRHDRDVAKVVRCSADNIAGDKDVIHLSCPEEGIADHSAEAVVLTGNLGRQRICARPGGPDDGVRLDAFAG
jgi:hypothetical protein